MPKRLGLKNCPFCGDIPEIETLGSNIDISCCVFMNIQKSDYLTTEQRVEWGEEKMRYPDEIEIFLYNLIVKRWNQRS